MTTTQRRPDQIVGTFSAFPPTNAETLAKWRTLTLTQPGALSALVDEDTWQLALGLALAGGWRPKGLGSQKNAQIPLDRYSWAVDRERSWLTYAVACGQIMRAEDRLGAAHGLKDALRMAQAYDRSLVEFDYRLAQGPLWDQRRHPSGATRVQPFAALTRVTQRDFTRAHPAWAALCDLAAFLDREATLTFEADWPAGYVHPLEEPVEVTVAASQAGRVVEYRRTRFYEPGDTFVVAKRDLRLLVNTGKVTSATPVPPEEGLTGPEGERARLLAIAGAIAMGRPAA